MKTQQAKPHSLFNCVLVNVQTVIVQLYYVFNCLLWNQLFVQLFCSIVAVQLDLFRPPGTLMLSTCRCSLDKQDDTGIKWTKLTSTNFILSRPSEERNMCSNDKLRRRGRESYFLEKNRPSRRCYAFVRKSRRQQNSAEPVDVKERKGPRGVQTSFL